MTEPIIKVENLSKRYRIGAREEGYKTLREAIMDSLTAPIRNFKRLRKLTRFDDSLPSALCSMPSSQGDDIIWALKDVSFEVKQGEVVGIIGRNGSGKTTLLKILSRITEPTTGEVKLYGRVSSLLEVGTGFHPELTGRENIYLNGAVLGMRKTEIDRKFDEIVAFAETEKFLDTPIKRYSSGMYVRLAFAVAAHLEPEILLVDEVLAVGDVAFQKKCLGKMGDVAREGQTVLFVSHNMAAVENLCGRGVLLNNGKIQFSGSIQHAVNTYMEENMKLNGEIILSKNCLLPKSKLRFIAVRILSTDGRPTAYVDILRGFTLGIEYEVFQSVSSAQVAFELWNSMGVCVLCSSDFDEHPEDSSNIKQPGRHSASCFIPPPYLRPGRYWITLSSSIPGVQILDEVRNAIAFEVVDSGSIESKLLQGRRGVILPILEWNTDRIY